MNPGIGILAVLFFSTLLAGQQTSEGPDVKLDVPSGAPLRIYLTKRVSKKVGTPVEGKILEPVFAFDREVIPAGSSLTGSVSRTQPVTKWQRVRAILNGDFTPLRSAFLSFDTLTLPNGSRRPLRTSEITALNSIYVEPSKKKKQQQAGPQAQNNGVMGTAKKAAKEQIKGAITSRTRGFSEIVRGPNKKEKLIDFMWAKLPYHPQYLRRGTRVDAPLAGGLEFGDELLKTADMAELGSQPAPGSVARVRLLTALDSHSAKQGAPVNAVLAAPLFSADKKLVLPEGTQLRGTIVVAKKARSFHRSGQLRFNFQTLELPAEVAAWHRRELAPAPLKTQAVLDQAEGSGPATLKVDSEGGVRAQESKTRFLAPMISLMLASRAADNDADRHHGTEGTGADGNIGGRTVGGGLGFGMVGSAVSQSSRYVGMAFGYYGLAWSVYRNVIAKGGEVRFDENAMMEIRFSTRPAAPSKFVEGGGSQ
jgi:hypothetical protein